MLDLVVTEFCMASGKMAGSDVIILRDKEVGNLSSTGFFNLQFDRLARA